MGNPVDDRTLKDEYPFEGLRGKKWDLAGVVELLAGLYTAAARTLKDGEPGVVALDSSSRQVESNSADILSSLQTLDNVDADLDKVTQSKSHTHTTAGTAESIVGDTAFSAGATVMIIGLDTWVAVGDDAAQAQGGDVKFSAGVPFTVQLDGTETTFHIDANTGGEVSIHQVS